MITLSIVSLIGSLVLLYSSICLYRIMRDYPKKQIDSLKKFLDTTKEDEFKELKKDLKEIEKYLQ